MHFHSKTIEETLSDLSTSSNGLSNTEVEKRRLEVGYNEISEIGKKHWFWILLKQFKSLLVLILFAAAAISLATNHIIDVYVILAVILINAAIGFFQELKAERAVASLRTMIVPQSKVIREGKSQLINAKELVPGDIIILEEGDSIPADARLIEAKNLRSIEAPLTGESVPSGKDTEVLKENTPLADRKNMVFKGCFIAGGYGLGVVSSTGMNTAFGDIAKTLKSIKVVKTNFQKKTDVLAKQMGVIAVLSAALLFLIIYFFQEAEIEEILLVSIAALVSAIPEGLPAVLAIVLAIGAGRMAQKNAIIREFTATETLGAVTTIITDKTGTLTQNTLTVCRVGIPQEGDWKITGEGWSPKGNFILDKCEFEPELSKTLSQFLKIAGWSNNSDIRFDEEKNLYQSVGDPTECALMVLAMKGNFFPKEDSTIKKVDDLPFSSELKMRATLIETPEAKRQYFIVGAPEQVLEKSSSLISSNGNIPMTPELADEIREKIELWSGEAMRVIALAYKEVDDNTEKIDDKNLTNLVFSGIVGMIDPPRPDVRKAVLSCKEAGIRVIMATGDHVKTAIAIAKASAILDEHEENALTEKELLKLDEADFEKAILNTNVFARLTPNMKLRIAEVLQAKGELIAMTGDGVNDAPALKKADVGVAMGIMGTDVARDSAQVILADDNFSTIVHAIEEGRIVFTNARITSFFLVTTNFAEIITLVTAVTLGMPIPLTATQILWLNLVTDGVGDLSLATEGGHGDILKEKPVNPKENILNKTVVPFLIINSILMATLALLSFKYFLPQGIEKARSAAFIIMAFSQLFNVFNMRSLKLSIFKIGMFSNKYVNIAIFISIIIQLMIIEIPFFERLFKFNPISFIEFTILGAMASSILWVGELYKYIRYGRISRK
jgi:Ca2+-transporting ATPase